MRVSHSIELARLKKERKKNTKKTFPFCCFLVWYFCDTFSAPLGILLVMKALEDRWIPRPDPLEKEGPGIHCLHMHVIIYAKTDGEGHVTFPIHVHFTQFTIHDKRYYFHDKWYYFGTHRLNQYPASSHMKMSCHRKWPEMEATCSDL